MMSNGKSGTSILHIYGPGYDDQDNQNQANVSSAKYYMLRAFSKYFFETDHYTETTNVSRFGM